MKSLHAIRLSTIALVVASDKEEAMEYADKDSNRILADAPPQYDYIQEDVSLSDLKALGWEDDCIPYGDTDGNTRIKDLDFVQKAIIENRIARIKALLSELNELEALEVARTLKEKSISLIDIEQQCKEIYLHNRYKGGLPVQAIHHYRSITGCGLLEAKDKVEGWITKWNREEDHAD